MNSVMPIVPSRIENETTKSNQNAATREAIHALQRFKPEDVTRDKREPAKAILAHPAAWKSVHQPSPMKKFEIIATSTAKAAPRRAPSWAPTKSAATVTGCTLGSGCMTTRSKETERTRLIRNKESKIGRLVGLAKSQKAQPNKTTSMSRAARGERAGPCTPIAWNMIRPKRVDDLRLT